MGAAEDSVKVATLIPKIWKERTLPALQALAEKTVLEAVQYAKANRPWDDQTTNAKNFLNGDTLEPGYVGFFVAHGVQYGVYLELANDRKYEILTPTIEVWGNKYLMDVRRFIGD